MRLTSAMNNIFDDDVVGLTGSGDVGIVTKLAWRDPEEYSSDEDSDSEHGTVLSGKVNIIYHSVQCVRACVCDIYTAFLLNTRLLDPLNDTTFARDVVLP